MLSINDIKTILAPMSKNFFEDEEALQLKQIYQQVTSEENLQLQQNIQDIREKIETSLHTFPDVPDSSKEYLRLFSLIFSLSYDIYMKKQMLESIVDTMNELSGSDSSQKSEKKDKKSKKE